MGKGPYRIAPLFHGRPGKTGPSSPGFTSEPTREGRSSSLAGTTQVSLARGPERRSKEGRSKNTISFLHAARKPPATGSA